MRHRTDNNKPVIGVILHFRELKGFYRLIVKAKLKPVFIKTEAFYDAEQIMFFYLRTAEIEEFTVFMRIKLTVSVEFIR